LTTEEIWKPVVGYEGLYEVSNRGRVRSLDRRRPHNGHTRFFPGQVLTPATHRQGYYSVKVCGGRRELVHRLMAKAFIPNPENLPLVRHLNDVKTDNRLENLAWGTYSENSKDSVRNNVHSQASKTHCKKGHPYDEKNTYYPPYPGGARRACRACQSENSKRHRRKRVEGRGEK
jgi:hypothetical protein